MRCIAQSMPFALSLQPGETAAAFYASDRVTDLTAGNIPANWNGFIIASFGLGYKQFPEGIEAKYSVNDILSMADVNDGNCATENLTANLPNTYSNATNYSEYEQNITRVTTMLDGKDGKTVISRLETLCSNRPPHDVAEKYFTEFTSCFRAMFYTPGKGLWIVATPETLMEYRNSDHTLTTMSLAGTRQTGETQWDKKNTREHELVTEYIYHTLEDAGMSVTVLDSENLPFGKIEHLCNRIEAKGDISPLRLAIKLSPTPAVCGWPVSEAYNSICNLEHHSRECYGGFIGTADKSDMKLYVNLRCCKIARGDDKSFLYNLYAGGGINSMSNPRDEWEETEHKIGPLKRIIQNN